MRRQYIRVNFRFFYTETAGPLKNGKRASLALTCWTDPSVTYKDFRSWNGATV